jgi:archaemetzincin
MSSCQCASSTEHEATPPSLLSMGSPSTTPSSEEQETLDVAQLHRAIRTLTPLHADKHEPGPHDWLASHQEGGQTFDAYRRDDPVIPDLDRSPGKRHTLYIQRLGSLTPTQDEIVELTAQYMHRFFGVPVKLAKPLPMTLVPDSARRTHPSTGTRQILTSYVLNNVLQPRLPDDAVAYISLTASDLWPGAGWNFVFGQASLTERVGVWSVHRYGDPDESDAAFRRALMRTIKVAVHETGHMFSMKHCTAHECVMGGSNNLDETDRAPVWLCPQCMAKMCWATHTDPIERYAKLAKFMRKRGFTEEAAFFERSMVALSSATSR